MKTCEGCGKVIPPERLEALANTTTCTQCSKVVVYNDHQVETDANCYEAVELIRSASMPNSESR